MNLSKFLCCKSETLKTIQRSYQHHSQPWMFLDLTFIMLAKTFLNCFQEVKQTNKQTENTSVVDIEDMDGKAVVYELSHSIVREVRDEVSFISNIYAFSFPTLWKSSATH